jgi:hypothetical protein
MWRTLLYEYNELLGLTCIYGYCQVTATRRDELHQNKPTGLNTTFVTILNFRVRDLCNGEGEVTQTNERTHKSRYAPYT